MEKKSLQISFQILSALLLLCSVVLEKDTFFSRSFWYRLRAFAKPARTQLLSLEQSDGE